MIAYISLNLYVLERECHHYTEINKNGVNLENLGTDDFFKSENLKTFRTT